MKIDIKCQPDAGEQTSMQFTRNLPESSVRLASTAFRRGGEQDTLETIREMLQGCEWAHVCVVICEI